MSSERKAPLTILSVVVLVVFASIGLGRFGFSMVLPTMQEGLGLSNSQAGQLQSWNSLGYLLCVVGAGMLATRYGARLVIALALGLVGVAMIATGLLPTFGVACITRFLSGAGGAAANVPAMGLLAAWFSGRRRGLAAGCAVAGSSLGLAATGVGVPLILAHYGVSGWRQCWYAFGGITLAVCACAAMFLRNRPGELVGTAHTTSPATAPEPSRISLLSPPLVKAAIAYFAFGFSYSIYATFFVKHLVRDFGMSTAEAGTVWTQIGLGSIVSGFIWGALSDRWGRRYALLAIYVCQGVAFLLVGFGNARSWAMLSGGLFACTAWSIPAVISAYCGDQFGSRLAPTALGIVTVVFGVGQVLGPFCGGLIADASGSFAGAFAAAGCAALLLGGGASLGLPGCPAVEAAPEPGRASSGQ